MRRRGFDSLMGCSRLLFLRAWESLVIRELGELESVGSNPAALTVCDLSIHQFVGWVSEAQPTNHRPPWWVALRLPTLQRREHPRDVGKRPNPPALGAGNRRFESGRPDWRNESHDQGETHAPTKDSNGAVV